MGNKRNGNFRALIITQSGHRLMRSTRRGETEKRRKAMRTEYENKLMWCAKTDLWKFEQFTCDSCIYAIARKYTSDRELRAGLRTYRKYAGNDLQKRYLQAENANSLSACSLQVCSYVFLSESKQSRSRRCLCVSLQKRRASCNTARKWKAWKRIGAI